MFEHKNVQNGTILRDVFIFWTWQHPKQSNSARLPHFSKCKKRRILRNVLQKWKVECRADRLVPMRFVIFPVHLSKVLRLPRKIDARSYEVLLFFFPSSAIWLSPGRLSIRTASCILQIPRINAVATSSWRQCASKGAWVDRYIIHRAVTV